ncbi:DUF2339 domain-containing protein [Reinekea blandensis]|uniref:DUF2339 domain-containing protein n=1 Tax=Reinekea blandensis MED297 TaxID=314283 RepID=A4BI47_9GAMM|nr:DUF2339 domain-containing protein [Reinekea blandensis]EAR08190.1 hypothetical protein MED297_14665 [Reinekea sp. MED297] [Reinekea blandensis MED297]
MELLLSLLGLAFIVAFGLALFGVPVLFRRLNQLSREVQELRSQLRQPVSEPGPQAVQSSIRQSKPTVAEATSETPPSEVVVAEPEVESKADTVLTPELEQTTKPTSAWASIQEGEPTEPKETGQFQSLINKLLSMNLTAQVGAIVLIFGAVFLGKYASDIGLLTFTAKLVLMGVASITLTLVGIRFQARLKVFADVLQATGLAGWLVTLFVGHVLYELLPWWLAFGGGLAGVLLIGQRALRQDSQALAMVAFLGGFITPFIASSEVASLWRLFGYLAVLNAAVVWIGWHKPWRWLIREATVGTFGLIGALMLAEHLQDDLLRSDIQWPFAVFLLVTLVEFSVLAAGWLRQNRLVVDRHASGLLFGVPAATVVGLQTLLANQAILLAVVLVAIGVWYWGLSRWSRSVFRLPAIVFTSMAVPYALSDGLTSLTYALEGLGFVYWASKYQRRIPLFWGLGLQIVSAVFAFRLFLEPVVQAEQLWLSWILYGGVVVTGLISGWWLRQGSIFKPVRQQWLEAAVVTWAVSVWYYQWGFWLAESLTQQWTFFAFPIITAVTVILTGLAAWRLHWSVMWMLLRLSSLLLLFSGLVFLEGYSHRASWPMLTGLAALSAGLLLVRYRINQTLLPAKAWDGFLVWFGLVALTAGALYAAPTFMTDWNLALATVAVLVPGMFLRPALRRLIPPAPYRRFARVLYLFIIAGLVTTTLSRLGNYAPLPFWPIFHPVLLVGLLGCEILFRFVRRLRYWRLAWVLLVGLVLTMELNRWLFHYVGVDFNLDAWLSSPLTQMVWSLSWTLLGGLLMITGARQSLSRSRWALGAGILGLIVLKLFVLDLAAVDTLYRILSFLGVGALLLAIGYIAPMPDRPAVDVKENDGAPIEE